MPNIENLKLKDSNQSRDEARENGRKGGIASGEARRRKKALKEQLDLLLSLPVTNTKTKNKIKKLGIEEDDIDNQMAMTVSIYQKASKGNVKAYELIRDTLGEKPIEKVSVDNSKATKVLESINKQLNRKKQ